VTTTVQPLSDSPADKPAARPLERVQHAIATAAVGGYGEADLARLRNALRRSGARPTRRQVRSLLEFAAAGAR